MKQPKSGVSTQLHFAISIYKSYPGQRITPHCTLDI